MPLVSTLSIGAEAEHRHVIITVSDDIIQTQTNTENTKKWYIEILW